MQYSVEIIYCFKMANSLGPLLRLEGLSLGQLPPGASKPGEAAARTDLTQVEDFIRRLLAEAIPFIDGVAPKSGAKPSWKKRSGVKRYESSEGAVYSYEHHIPGTELDKIAEPKKSSKKRSDENWYCRYSVHRNAAEKGTASWDEFVHTFRDHHYESEEQFASTVIGARAAMLWDTSNMTVEVEGQRWANMKMKVVEMKHQIDPRPLNGRTFPVLQLTTSLDDLDELIVVSLPVKDFSSSSYAEYARDRSLVVGMYASVERIRVLPQSGEIEWIMATTSDAKGVLPQWMQNLAVPSKITEDVDLFMKWIVTTRNSKAN